MIIILHMPTLKLLTTSWARWSLNLDNVHYMKETGGMMIGDISTVTIHARDG
jgi:hypothetical protein